MNNSSRVLPVATAPKFSVVIATYNYGHMIKKTIDSVLLQTFSNFELIVVDDGSTDNTPEIMRQFEGKLQYFWQENGGQSTAINFGADIAKGEYVYILDADDTLLPDALKHFANAIAVQPSTEQNCIFFGGYISVSADGRERVRPGTEAPKGVSERLKAFLCQRISGLKNGAFIAPRHLFKHVRYPENLRNNTDIVFLGQALALMPAVQIHALVLRSCEHPLRVRKQLDKVLQTGTTPVDTLFDPRVISAELMVLRRVYFGCRMRSIARLLYFHEYYAKARDAYFAALIAYPACMIDLSSLRKMLISVFRGFGNKK
jgi:hypothetical protein